MDDKKELSRKKSILDYFYNTLLIVAEAVFPLLTSYYISVKLGATNIGIVNIVISLSTWFCTNATFGINNFGIREIASNRFNPKKTKQTFSALITLQASLVTLCNLVYVGVIFVRYWNNPTYLLLGFIAGFNLFMTIFNTDWLFQGLAKFKYISIRSIIVKLIFSVLIFVCIRSEGDFYIYALLLTFGKTANNIFNVFWIKRKIGFTKPPLNTLKSYFKRATPFGLSNLFGSIYNSFDKVILGILLTDTVAFALYNRSLSIVTLALSFVYAVSKTLISNVSYLYSQNRVEEAKNIQKSSFNSTFFIMIPIALCVFVFSSDLMRLFGGEEFVLGTYILKTTSLVIISNGLANWCYNQMIIPLKKEKQYLFVQIAVAVFSVLSNWFLFGVFGVLTCPIVLIISEFLISIFCFIVCKKEMSTNNIFSLDLFKIFLSGAVMLIVMWLTNFLIQINYIVKMILGGFIGIVIYVFLLSAMGEKTAKTLSEFVVQIIKKKG